ncbi:MAG: type I glutamate--ammonia ligase, partial [Lachnospiraceae bacterium]|nr:type I glutamate--ammonia ligase [Lachnospiraceae bacterium]
KHFIGGIMAHAEGMCAVTNPTVNSYKRILAGFNAPGEINWSCRGEKALIRHHRNADETKIELRFPDTSANPYLALALCIAAGLDGIENSLIPDQEDKLIAKRLPSNLMDAVDRMRKDEVLIEALGKEFSDIYAQLKRSECEDYMLQVSEWELATYLDRM